MKKLLLSLIAISLFVSPAFAQQDTVVEEIVARVNNAIITAPTSAAIASRPCRIPGR
jgi:hypothetical protein